MRHSGQDLCPLEFGEVPALEEDVVCVGFPTGGDNISVTRGVVSRVEIQRYAHSAVELLAIQVGFLVTTDTEVQSYSWLKHDSS